MREVVHGCLVFAACRGVGGTDGDERVAGPGIVGLDAVAIRDANGDAIVANIIEDGDLADG